MPGRAFSSNAHKREGTTVMWELGPGDVLHNTVEIWAESVIGRWRSLPSQRLEARVIANGVEVPTILQVTQYATRRPNELWLQECQGLIRQPRRRPGSG